MTCIRRYGAACATAQRLVPPLVLTDMFSAERQKFWVALPASLALNASTVTAPLMRTSSGFCPRPRIEVLKPMFAPTLYGVVLGLKTSASRRVPNCADCVSFCALKTLSSDDWMAASVIEWS